MEEGVKHERIKIRITNITESESVYIEDTDNQGEMISRESPCAMMVDGLLVFEENGDTGYYPNVNDVLTDL